MIKEHSFRDSVGVQIGTLHNDSLELLVTQGVFSLISYWGLLLISVSISIKNYLRSQDVYKLITIMLLIFLILLGMLETAIYVKRLVEFVFLFLAISLNKEEKYYGKI